MTNTRRIQDRVRGLLVVAALAPAASAQGNAQLTLNISSLPNLGSGWAYEGWVIVNGQPVSTGTFTVSDDGTMSQSNFTASAQPGQVSAFVLTIEPSPDPDPMPSTVHLVGGDFNNSTAALSVAHMDALGSDFSGASGSYVLAAPSAGEGGSYLNGIWWLDPSAGPGPALALPALPEGWAYEGWVVGMGTPVSTGRFTAVSGEDSDGAGPAAGPADAPPFPGQDFVNPPTDLTGYMAVLTIEPEPDNSPMPFALKPLVDETIEDVGAETLQPMANNATTFPTGTATLAAMGGAAGPAPQTMPVTGSESAPSSLPLAVTLAGLFLLGGAFALRLRTR